MESPFEQRLSEIVAERDPARAFHALAALYPRSTAEERERIRGAWPFGRRWRPPDPTRLACPVRGEPAPAVRCWTALLYHSIEDCRHDPRDNLVTLCAVHHSLLRLGLDARAEFERVAALSSSATAALLRGWSARTSADQRLDQFGWAEETRSEGWCLAAR